MSWLNKYSNDLDYSVWNENGWADGSPLKITSEEPLPEQTDNNITSQSNADTTEEEMSAYQPLSIKPISYDQQFYNTNQSSSSINDGFYAGSQKANVNTTGKQIYDGLLQRGLSAIAAAGITGNIAAESSFKSGVTNSIGAFGLIQALGSRKKALFNLARETKRDASDVGLQLDFIVKELQGTHSHVAKQLQNATTPEQAARIVMEKYEIPSKKEQAQSWQRRRSNALAYYQPKADSGATLNSNWLRNYE